MDTPADQMHIIIQMLTSCLCMLTEGCAMRQYLKQASVPTGPALCQQVSSNFSESRKASLWMHHPYGDDGVQGIGRSHAAATLLLLDRDVDYQVATRHVQPQSNFWVNCLSTVLNVQIKQY